MKTPPAIIVTANNATVSALSGHEIKSLDALALDFTVDLEDWATFSFPDIPELSRVSFKLKGASDIVLLVVKYPQREIEAVYSRVVVIDKKVCCNCNGWTVCGWSCDCGPLK